MLQNDSIMKNDKNYILNIFVCFYKFVLMHQYILTIELTGILRQEESSCFHFDVTLATLRFQYDVKIYITEQLIYG